MPAATLSARDSLTSSERRPRRRRPRRAPARAVTGHLDPPSLQRPVQRRHLDDGPDEPQGQGAQHGPAQCHAVSHHERCERRTKIDELDARAKSPARTKPTGFATLNPAYSCANRIPAVPNACRLRKPPVAKASEIRWTRASPRRFAASPAVSASSETPTPTVRKRVKWTADSTSPIERVVQQGARRGRRAAAPRPGPRRLRRGRCAGVARSSGARVTRGTGSSAVLTTRTYRVARARSVRPALVIGTASPRSAGRLPTLGLRGRGL